LVPQRRPQAPQLFTSPCRFWHAPLHEVSPVEHAVTHWPLSQTWPTPHTVPQAPQCCGLVCVDTQRLLQSVLPAGHRHVPLKQLPPGPHALPQAPQLFTSFWVKVQVPLQKVWPGKHEAWQLKLVQTWPAWQRVPQLPQLFGSLRGTHALLQRMKPEGQLQVELLQVPPWQLLPQAPQLCGSVWVLVHRPLQVT
jgi:hypothetical protein